MPPRIGILGARRIRQGLGPYFARFVEHHGGEVCAFASSRWSSVDPTAAALEQELGHGVAGYVGLDSMLQVEDLDGLIIAAPIDTHEDALLGALDAGVHVLCEKPIIRPRRGATDRVQTLLDAFAMRDLHLMVNVQWPLTLPSYFELFPAAAGATIDSFWMRLSPSSIGIDAIIDSMPHALSMLQALVADEGAMMRRPDIEFLNEDASHIDVRFLYDAGGCTVESLVELRHGTTTPREAGYGVNGFRVRRRIELPSYDFFFDAGEASVAVQDPLGAMVGTFVSRLSSGAGGEIDVSASVRMRMLETLMA